VIRIVIGALPLMVSVNLAAAAEGERCKATDPTGTPLNVRESPNGKTVGTVNNGVLVSIIATKEINGKPWVCVRDYKT
jgi:hypothetical protein